MYHFRFVILAILTANEKLSISINDATDNVDVLFEDLENFVKNSYTEMNFITSSAMETTLDKVNELLESNKTLFSKIEI